MTGSGPWNPNAMRVSERILVSAWDPGRVGLTEHRSCAIIESSAGSPTGSSVVPVSVAHRRLLVGPIDVVPKGATSRMPISAGNHRSHVETLPEPIAVPWTPRWHPISPRSSMALYVFTILGECPLRDPIRVFVGFPGLLLEPLP